jgi:molecular chaperone GrpE
LEVADNFERALEAASNSADFKSLHSGTELIYQHLLDVLEKEGVEPIKAVGEKFDPALHEAVMQIESDDYPEGVIAQEMTKGYKLKGRVIRFSKVVVSKGGPDKQNQE